MDNRYELMQSFLKNVAKEFTELNKKECSSQFVYEKLTAYGLEEKDIKYTNGDEEIYKFWYNQYYMEKSETEIEQVINQAQTKKVGSLKDEKCGDYWIELIQFPIVKNMCAAQDKNFMYFKDEENNNFDGDNSKNSIKMYIPLGKKGVSKLLQKALIFLKSSKIQYNSKLATKIGTDDFVISVNTIEDAKRISDFINLDSAYDDGEEKTYADFLINTNPFIINDRRIGYTVEKNLSYNLNIADYISQYINEENNLEEVSVEGLKKYVEDKYQAIFVNGTELDRYIAKGSERYKCDNLEDWLINKKEITDMFLLSLNSESTLEDFYKYFNHVNDEEYTRELRYNLVNLMKNVKLETLKNVEELKAEETIVQEQFNENKAEEIKDVPQVEQLGTNLELANSKEEDFDKTTEILKLAKKKIKMMQKVQEAKELLNGYKQKA